MSMLTIVPPHKSIAIGSPLDAVDVLHSLFESNVHVSVNRLEFSCLRG